MRRHARGEAGEVARVERLRAVAERDLGVLVDLDDDPVGADRGRAARASGSTSRRSPDAWLGSTMTGRCVCSFSHGTAERSSVKRVAVSNVRIPRSHSITRSLPSLRT